MHYVIGKTKNILKKNGNRHHKYQDCGYFWWWRKERWLQVYKGAFGLLVILCFFTWVGLLYYYLLNFTYMSYVPVCIFQDKTRKGEWSVTSNVAARLGIMRTEMSIGLSKVETSDEHSTLSQWSGGTVIWLDWARETGRKEELETMSKQNLEEFLCKKKYSRDWRWYRKLYTKYIEYQENIKINFLERWRQ